MKNWMGRFGVCLGGALSCACSFIFVSGPPARAETHEPRVRPEPVDCTSSKAAPIIDTVIAGYQAFRTGYALQADDSDYVDVPIKREADIGIGAGLTALFTAAAVYGYVVTGKCSDAKETYARQRVPPPSPPPVAGPPSTFTYAPPQAPPGAMPPPPAPPPPAAPPAATQPAPETQPPLTAPDAGM